MRRKGYKQREELHSRRSRVGIGFAGVALLLAAVGLFGVISCLRTKTGIGRENRIGCAQSQHRVDDPGKSIEDGNSRLRLRSVGVCRGRTPGALELVRSKRL